LTISRAGKALAFTIVAGTIAGSVGTVAGVLFSNSSEALPKLARHNLVFPEANRDTKQDRLKIVVGNAPASEPISYELASAPSSDVAPPVQSVATATPMKSVSNPTTASIEPIAKPKPAVPKLPSAALVRDNQIATMKERLRLTAAQEAYWPAVESALRGVLVQVYEAKRRGDNSIDANSAEVQRLKSAAMPLLFQMREDQKREVRNFAQVIGLADVASMI
jgi:hypothetical protein